MTRDAIMAELLEIEGLLQDDRLNDDDRHALDGCVYRKLKLGRSGGEVHQGWRVI
jgi:hypothetical protein